MPHGRTATFDVSIFVIPPKRTSRSPKTTLSKYIPPTPYASADMLAVTDMPKSVCLAFDTDVGKDTAGSSPTWRVDNGTRFLMQHLEILWLVSVERLTTPRYRPAPPPLKCPYVSSCNTSSPSYSNMTPSPLVRFMLASCLKKRPSH